MHTNQPSPLWFLTLSPRSETDILRACLRPIQTLWQRIMNKKSNQRILTYLKEEKMAKDTLGRMIAIGDTVAYAVRNGNSADLKIGDVVQVKNGRICVEAENCEGRLSKRTLSHMDRIAVLHSPKLLRSLWVNLLSYNNVVSICQTRLSMT